MQTSEAADVGIGFRVFDLDSCGSELGYHSVEVMHPKVHHPGFVGISEIFRGLGKGAEGGRPGLLLPNSSTLGRGGERDSQVLLVPVRQPLVIMISDEQSSDSGYLFHLRSS